jgi:diguanylate cyclase (GGDEF)-like protein/PAS domain S-box-containing protein
MGDPLPSSPRQPTGFPFGAHGLSIDAEALYRAPIEHIPAVVYLDPVSEEGSSLYVSPHVEALLGVTPEQWMADAYCWGRHVHPDDLDWVWEDYERAVAEGSRLDRQYRMIHEDGTVRWVLEQAFPIPGPDGATAFLQGFLFDVTDRNTEELAFLAYHDKLTGLPNRALFEEMLGLATARARRNDAGVALLFLDLDNFKIVNDTMGHQAGDRLLAAVVERLRPCVRDADMFARRSGDEFLVLLSDIEGGGPDGRERCVFAAETVAERIVQALEEPFEVLWNAFTASTSIGISLFPTTPSTSPRSKHADGDVRSKRTRPRLGVHSGRVRPRPSASRAPSARSSWLACATPCRQGSGNCAGCRWSRWRTARWSVRRR